MKCIVNESNFEKVELWQISHASRNTKISFEEISVAKESVLVIYVSDVNTAKGINSKTPGHCTNKYAKEEKNTTS